MDKDALYTVLRDRATAQGYVTEATAEVERARKALEKAEARLAFAEGEVKAQDERADAVIAGKNVMPRPVRVFGQS